MSGLYNMIMGQNPFLGILLSLLGVNPQNYPSLGRIRDAWITADAQTINVLHRNYGEDGAPFDKAVATMPGFVAKHMDPTDETYGWYEFSVKDLDLPAEHKEQMLEAAKNIAKVSDNTNCMERYRQAVEDLKNGVDNEQTRHMMKVGQQVIGDLAKSIETGKTVASGDVVIERLQ